VPWFDRETLSIEEFAREALSVQIVRSEELRTVFGLKLSVSSEIAGPLNPAGPEF